jgi:transposase
MSDGIPVGGRFVGVDLHSRRSVICRIDAGGVELACVQIDNDPKALVREVRRAGRGAPVAIEAIWGWYWAVDALRAAGCQVHLAHPYGMKAMRKRKRVKTDAKDAYELANLLRLGSLPEAYIAPRDLREVRELVRHRQRLTEANTAVKAGIRALLAKHNIHLPVCDLESGLGTELLDRVSLAAAYLHRLESQRRQMLLLEAEIGAVEVELDRRLKRNRDYRNLQKIKGIGPVLAAVLVAEIGDVTRFGGPGQLACWAGLTPRHYASDRTTRRGHISKEGSVLVRWAAVEAIQRQCEPTVRELRDRIVARRGPGGRNIAKIAAAHRMLDIVYYTLRDGTARAVQNTKDAA